MKRLALCLALLVVSPLATLLPAASAQDAPPGQGDPHAGVPGAPPRERQIATAEANPEVPTGSIRVTVVDQAGAPVRDAEVNIGVMGAEGRRERVRQRTDATGVTTFSGLPTGTIQAYRVNLPYAGAMYSSNPFQLPTNQGFAVRITRLPTTRDPSTILLVRGELALELREGRMHVSQRAQLMNLGQETYVFPAGGLPIVLPAGFTAPQTEPLMTDQKLLGYDRGYKLSGSLPPGAVVLSWAFDLPLEGAEQTIELAVPFRTYLYRVLTDAPEGATLEVEAVTSGDRSDGTAPSKFTEPQIAENDGRRLFVSQLERTPQDPALQRIRVRFSGLPTPGPLRWIAAIGAFLLAAAGVFVAATSGAAQSGDSLATRRTAVLEAIEALEQQRARDEIGPRTYEHERERLVIELAAVIRAEERRQAAEAGTPRGAKRPAVTSPKSAPSR